jgi:chemotaxis methyl-accepting protein methylase
MSPSTRSILQFIPGARRLSRGIDASRHRMTLLLAKRQNYVFTHFLRTPTQFDALVGPVLDHVRPARSAEPLRIALFGCSSGAEPTTIASQLAKRRPDVRFSIRAFDIEDAMVAKARSAAYTRDEVFSNKTLPASFVDSTFDVAGDAYAVKPAIASRVTFELGNALEADARAGAGQYDLVFAQNFLFHLKPADAEQAFEAIARCLAPRSALFVDGADLGMRTRLTETLGLEPLEFGIDAIHEEARVERGGAWPLVYWGLEPMSKTRADWKRRYATIFLKR